MNSDDVRRHVVITRHVRRLRAALTRFLPGAPVTVCGGFSELLTQRPPLSKLQGLSSSDRVRRKELLSPFNFAAFYLPCRFPSPQDTSRRMWT